MRLLFLGNAEECIGFSLCGAQTFEAGSEKEFEAEMSKLLDLDDAGVIIVADRFFESYSKTFSKKMRKRAVPAVVFVPSFDGRHASTDIKGYLSGVLGIRL